MAVTRVAAGSLLLADPNLRDAGPTYTLDNSLPECAAACSWPPERGCWEVGSRELGMESVAVHLGRYVAPCSLARIALRSEMVCGPPWPMSLGPSVHTSSLLHKAHLGHHCLLNSMILL